MYQTKPWLAVLAITLGLYAGTARAEETGPADGNTAAASPSLTTEQRLQQLEQDQAIMKRKMEIDEEARQAKAKETPVVTAGREGFSMSAADGSARVRIRGLIHADGRFYVDDQPKAYQNGMLLRRVRPIIEGTLWRYYDFKFVPDFGDGKAVIQDAYVDARLWPYFGIMVGKYKEPVGLERLQGISDTTFVEFSLPTFLVPNRDIGVMVHGDLFEGVLNYSAGVFNGVPDGASADRNVDGMFDYAGRIFLLPFKTTDIEPLRGLGFGIGGSSGYHYGTLASPEVGSYKTAGQMTWFKYRSDGKNLTKTVVADGLLNRYSPQAYYFWGPLGVTYEYAVSEQHVRIAPKDETLTNEAWQVTASFVITGEDASYKMVKPRQAFDPTKKTWGAWEIAGRYSELTVDDDAYPIYADPLVTAGRARSWGAGCNWYLNSNVKAMLDYDETMFVDGTTRPLPTERMWFGRVQVAF